MEQESNEGPRHYHAWLEAAGWSFVDVDEVYRKQGRVFVAGAGPKEFYCDVDLELLDIAPHPVEAAECEFDATLAAAEAAAE